MLTWHQVEGETTIMNMLTHCRNTKGELDSTLSAVLCDAAVRDLVHDNYNARPEALHVPDFIKKSFNYYALQVVFYVIYFAMRMSISFSL